MKKSNMFIVILCLLVALSSMAVAFTPMIKNLRDEAKETESNDTAASSDESSDVESDEISDSDSDESSDVDSDESEVPADESSDADPDESEVPGDESSDIESDENSDSESESEPAVQGHTVTVIADCTCGLCSHDFTASWIDSNGETVTITETINADDEALSLTCSDVCSEITLTCTSGGIKVVCNDETLIDESGNDFPSYTGSFTLTVSEDTTVYVYSFYV